MQLFEKAVDYQAFEQVLRDTLDQSPMRICAYAVMPNHWHLLLWPECDGELAAFMQRLTITHVRRWQEHRGYAGLGHVYQGRYKSFPVEPIVPPSAAPSRPVNFGLGDLVLIATCLYTAVW